MYPANWPRCPNCGQPAVDGHITCGRAQCDEGGARRARPQALRLHGKQRQLILAASGRRDMPVFKNGGLAPALARLRRMGLFGDGKLTAEGERVAAALANGEAL